MVVVNYSGKEINAKIVYYGPGLCGKTTNLERIYDSVPGTNKGKMISMKTKTDRTLFFDFLPLELGDIAGFRTRLMLYTVPGQVFYNATRKLVLKGVDAVVFVADSERGKMRENQASLENLRENLVSYGIDVSQIPIVFQYNKRDLPEVYTREELDRGLDRGSRPAVEAVAAKGEGVFETLRIVSKLLLTSLHQKLRGTGPALGEASVGPLAADAVTGRLPGSPSREMEIPPALKEAAESAWAAFPPATHPAAEFPSFGGRPVTPSPLSPIETPIGAKSMPEIELAPGPSIPERKDRREARPDWMSTPEAAVPEPRAEAPSAAPWLPAPASSSSSPLDIVRLGAGESRRPPRQIVVPVEIDPSELKDGHPIELILRIEIGPERRRAA